MKSARIATLAAVAGALVASAPALAQSPQAFYEGRKMDMVIG